MPYGAITQTGLRSAEPTQQLEPLALSSFSVTSLDFCSRQTPSASRVNLRQAIQGERGQELARTRFPYGSYGRKRVK